jgi:hypothetical protein
LAITLTALGPKEALAENRLPAIWLPSKELLDLRALVRHRHQWVRIRTRIQNALQAIALANGLRRGPGLWSYDGQAKIAFLPLLPHAAYRRSALQAMYKNMEAEIEKLTQQVAEQAGQRSGARRLMTHPLLVHQHLHAQQLTQPCEIRSVGRVGISRNFGSSHGTIRQGKTHAHFLRPLHSPFPLPSSSSGSRETLGPVSCMEHFAITC